MTASPKGFFARELSLRTPKPEQNESRKQIIGTKVTDAFSFFSLLRIGPCYYNLRIIIISIIMYMTVNTLNICIPNGFCGLFCLKLKFPSLYMNIYIYFALYC